MKKSKRILAISLALIFAFSTVTISADAARTRSSSNNSSFSSFWDSVWDFFTGWGQSGDDSGSSEGSSSSEESVVPDVYYAENARAGVLLAADGATPLAADNSDRYFKSTLFNYSTEWGQVDGKPTINDATKALDLAQNPSSSTPWQGIYFSSGDPAKDSTNGKLSTSYTYESGSSSTQSVNVAPEATASSSISTAGRVNDGNTSGSAWNFSSRNTSYSVTLTWNSVQTITKVVLYTYRYSYISSISVEYYLDGSWNTIPAVSVQRTMTYQLSAPVSASRLRVTVTSNSTRNQSRGLYEVEAYVDQEVSGSTTITKDFANWNYWTGNDRNGGTNYKAWIYGGLVEKALGTDGSPVFKVPEAGIFDTSDTTTKNVYTNVGIPFSYDSATKTYTFDSQQNNASFANNQYASNTDLTKTDPLYVDDNGNQKKGFYPFNDLNSLSGEYYNGTTASRAYQNATFHFGMSMSVPFTMTSNGRIDSQDDTSAPIKFEFAGDDDVWVFIDGQLVLDLGGIHDSVSGTLDFANNTITMYSTDNPTGLKTGDVSRKNESGYAGAYQKSLGQLFNTEADGTSTAGVLSTTLEQFSGAGEHTLQIFYLERGRGVSNCKISFNLPMQDSVEVTKSVKTASGAALMADQQAAVDKMDFEFQLNRIDPDSGASVVAANATYSLYGANSSFIGIRKTDQYGKFTLKNGQTARFYGEVTNYYQVTETTLSDAYESPEWTWSFNNTQQGGVTTGYVSQQTNQYSASTEVADKVAFNCTNILDDTFVIIGDETLVLDYGKSVIIDVLANDAQSAVDGVEKPLSLQAVTGAVNGTAEIVSKAADGSYVPVADPATDDGQYRYIRYTPNTYMSSIDELTYTLESAFAFKLNGEDTATTTHTATATVIPATSVYYEENLKKADGTDYINFSAEGWTYQDVPANNYQEPGVVGTRNDSPYGSDRSYLTGNTGDSNGTSAHATSGSTVFPSFNYEFTGTGTAIFARSTAATGYIRVRILQNGEQVRVRYIDTLYLGAGQADGVTGDTLYNLPIYNINDLDYGTYTVEVTLSKPMAVLGNRCDFYLDGIRVYNPLDPAALDARAADAYATDLESDAIVITLRDKLLTSATVEDENGDLVWADGNNFTVFTDTNGTVVTAEDYESNGPKNEMYLTTGQSIHFLLSDWFNNQPNNVKIYLGAKSPAGGSMEMILNQGTATEKTITLNSTVDCYYDITNIVTAEGYDGKITITAGTGKLLSLTNIKITGYPEFDIGTNPSDPDIGGSEGGN